LAGCPIPIESDLKNTLHVETASGVIEVPTFTLENFTVFNIPNKDFSVLTYDFLAKGLTSPYDGVLGIDFFRKQWILTIDFIEEKIWLANKKKITLFYKILRRAFKNAKKKELHLCNSFFYFIQS
jgi:hypothetical protein